MKDLSEKQLLRRAKRLDNDALAEIYDRYSDELYRYAMRLLNNDTTAEECVAETFSRFLQTLHRGKGPRDHIRAYLYRIAHNWIMDVYRKQPLPDVSLEPDTPVADETNILQMVAQRADAIWLRHALFELTEEQRQVLLLKFYEGWPNKEIAISLNKSVGSVKALQHRAIAALQRLVQKEAIV